MVCDIDHHCCCGVCAYGGVATCEEDGTWSTAMRETLYDQGCNRNSCKYNDWSDKDCNQDEKRTEIASAITILARRRAGLISILNKQLPMQELMKKRLKNILPTTLASTTPTS
eukprot:UN00935